MPVPIPAVPPPLSYRVAVLEFNPVLGAKGENEARLLAEIERQLDGGAALVVTPEMSNTGYHFDSREAIAALVEPIPGPFTERLTALARKTGGHIVTSMPEVDPSTGLYYIAAVLVGPGGVVGTYRKNHLWQQEEFWAAQGDLGVPVFDTPLGRIAINICMDVVFWETPRLAALAGADILVVPTNSSGQTVSLMPALAAQNGVYVVGANRAGTEAAFHMPGVSGVWSPEGEPLALSAYLPREHAAQGTRVVTASITPARAARARGRALAGRKPELYASVAFHAPYRKRRARAESVRVIALQLAPGTDAAALLEALKATALGAATAEARRTNAPLLIVAPELATAGPDPADPVAAAERTGRMVGPLTELARQARANLVVGAVVMTPSGPGNGALVVSSDGQLLGTYVKTHLDEMDQRWAAAGDRLGVFDLPGLGRIGVLLGDEARIPELLGGLSVARVDLIAIPSSLRADEARYLELPDALASGAYSQPTVLHWDAAARFSQAYVVAANYAEGPFAGRSAIIGIDPIYGLDRPFVASAGGRTVTADIDLARSVDWWFDQQHLIALRRPLLYRPLLARTREPLAAELRPGER